MKRFILHAFSAIVILTSGSASASASAPAAAQTAAARPVYVYKQITAVESVVPGGLGRSRILTTDDSDQMMEKELKNFYSMVGINFGNIANNDRAIMDRINEFAEQGWELVNVVSGNNQQTSDGNSSGGLFITRYIFRKLK